MPIRPTTDVRTVARGMAVLRRAIRTEPRPFAVAMLGALLYATATVGAALVFGAVTDRVVIPAYDQGRVSAGALALASAAIVGVAVAKAAGIVLRRVGASSMQFRLHARYRRRVAGQYLRLPMSWHRRHPTGELLSTLNADVEAAFAPIAPLPFSCGVVVLLAVAAVVLLVTDPVLAVVGAVAGPALALVNARYNRRTSGPVTRAQQLRGEVSSVAHESVDGALVVKTLGREEAETERFREVADRLRDELVAYGRVRAGFEPLMEAIPNVTTLLVVGVGAVRVASGDMSVGDLVRVAYLFTLLAFPVRMIGYLLSELPRSVVGWDRVARVLDQTGSTTYGGARLHGDGPAGVTLDRVTYRYLAGDGDESQGDVLHAVDIDVAPGRTVALVGPTGAGKSTIASLLVRLADPGRGEVRIAGAELRALAAGAVPGAVALVFQHTFLFDDTVRGNVTLGAPFTDEEVAEACRLAQADGFIRALPQGYDTQLGERGASLSGGQRQRVALARALVRRPRVLVLDDATSSVDPAVEAAILAGLRRAALPSTVVLVASRQATIALADEIVYVEHGHVLARGSHEQLLAEEPGYARLVHASADATADATADAAAVDVRAS